MSKNLKSEIVSTAIALGIMSVIAVIGTYFGLHMEQTIF
jgi:LytS/YehU family sensor histidine kinase